MDYRMQADDSADTANRRKTYIKQSGRGMRKSPKRFCLLTFVLIGDAPICAGSLALSATVDNTASTTRTLAVASGATLDLVGNTLTQPVISGAGTVQRGARVRHDWWSKSGGVTEFLVNCLPWDPSLSKKLHSPPCAGSADLA